MSTSQFTEEKTKHKNSMTHISLCSKRNMCQVSYCHTFLSALPIPLLPCYEVLLWLCSNSFFWWSEVIILWKDFLQNHALLEVGTFANNPWSSYIVTYIFLMLYWLNTKYLNNIKNKQKLSKCLWQYYELLMTEKYDTFFPQEIVFLCQNRGAQ